MTSDFTLSYNVERIHDYETAAKINILYIGNVYMGTLQLNITEIFCNDVTFYTKRNLRIQY